MKTHALAVTLLSLAFGGALEPAWAQTKWTDGMLTDEAGVPLFISERDRPNESDCNRGPCLGIWRPYLATSEARASGDHSIFKRQDGALQWAYKGKALYRWFNDEKPMDGEGMGGGNWHVVRQQ